jgi:hypothetical protein
MPLVRHYNSRAQRLARFMTHVEALQQPVQSWPEAERRKAQAAVDQFVASVGPLADVSAKLKEISSLRDLINFYHTTAPVVKRLVDLLGTIQNPI